MKLVQIFLPLTDNKNWKVGGREFQEVRAELTESFGGLTIYSRSPAEGLYQSGGEVARDDIVVFEVMTEELDRPWWADFRKRLEAHFRQEEILIRAVDTIKL